MDSIAAYLGKWVGAEAVRLGESGRMGVAVERLRNGEEWLAERVATPHQRKVGLAARRALVGGVRVQHATESPGEPARSRCIRPSALARGSSLPRSFANLATNARLIPDSPVLRVKAGRIEHVCPPDQVSDWCKPIVQAALCLERGRGGRS